MEGSQYISKFKEIFWRKKDHHLILIMDYAEGMTLREFIQKASKKDIKLSTEMATEIAYNLLSAINFIHQANVIHRDLKPANIMINDDLGITLLDFGHARTNPNKNSLDDIYLSAPIKKAEKKQLALFLSSSDSKQKRSKRTLSPHVITRLYRPPEVVF